MKSTGRYGMYGMYREVWNTSGNADCQGVIFSKSIIGAGRYNVHGPLDM